MGQNIGCCVSSETDGMLMKEMMKTEKPSKRGFSSHLAGASTMDPYSNPSSMRI